MKRTAAAAAEHLAGQQRSGLDCGNNSAVVGGVGLFRAAYRAIRGGDMDDGAASVAKFLVRLLALNNTRKT